MRIVRNIEQAKAKAQSMWGRNADAWIVAGTRFVSRDRLIGNPAPGWNHFDGQGVTWDAAFIDAAFNLKVAELKAQEQSKCA